MKLLAVETSTERCSVALARDNAMHVDEVDAGQRHSQLLNGMIVKLLEGQGLQVTDLDGLAFGSGPGSFTGLRIGCSVVQGMAFGLGCQVAPVGTLEALAEQALAEQAGTPRVLTALDARMGETYFAAWEHDGGNWRAVVAPCVGSAQDLPDVPGDGWVAIGSAFDHHAYMTERYGAQIALSLNGRYPSARDIARLALRIFARGAAVPPEDALPLYIRDKVALTVEERLALREAKAAQAATA